MATEEDTLSAVEEKRHEENPQEEASSFDPQKLLSRSTSDALLETGKMRALKRPIMAALSETDMSGSLPEALEDLDTPPVSERNRVYFDLTDVAETEGLDLEQEPAAMQAELEAPGTPADLEEGVFVGGQVGEGDCPQELTRVYDRKGGP